MGISFALGFDALSFMVSAITLWLMCLPQSGSDLREGDQKESVWKSIRAGVAIVWKDAGLRVIFMVTMEINLLVNGPILVGIPLLADTRFPEGAAAFGILMSAYGGGNLLGTLLAGALPGPKTKSMGSLMLAIISILGIGVVLLGLTASLRMAAAVGLVMGTANGYVSLLFITWLQSRTPHYLLGRQMSLLMFAAVGLNPISMALAGVFMKLDPAATFVGAGSLMVVIVLLAALHPEVRQMKAASFQCGLR